MTTTYIRKTKNIIEREVYRNKHDIITGSPRELISERIYDNKGKLKEKVL